MCVKIDWINVICLCVLIYVCAVKGVGKRPLVPLHRVPTWTGKPGKIGRHFPVREKSGNFEQTGKVREKSGKNPQNTGKLREFEINII